MGIIYQSCPHFPVFWLQGHSCPQVTSLRLRLRISPLSRARRFGRHIWHGNRCQWLPDRGIESCPVHSGKFRTTWTLPNDPEQVQVMSNVCHVSSQLAYVPYFLRKPAPIEESLLVHSIKIKICIVGEPAAATHHCIPPSLHLKPAIEFDQYASRCLSNGLDPTILR